jgi:membrane protein DedA with SNARE-associated domain
MLAFLIETFTKIISDAGYLGLTFLMSLESMIAPVPSEAVMPFAGFLIYQGKMHWEAVILFSTLGSIIGSLVSYYIGMNFGRPLIVKYGRYLLLNEHHLNLSERFFDLFGQKTIFISRFIPIVRHFISLPAGAARMNVWIFAVYTMFGAMLWNTFLTYLGYRLGGNWTIIRTYSEKLDIVVVALMALGIAYLYFKYRKKKKTKTA